MELLDGLTANLIPLPASATMGSIIVPSNLCFHAEDTDDLASCRYVRYRSVPVPAFGHFWAEDRKFFESAYQRAETRLP